MLETSIHYHKDIQLRMARFGSGKAIIFLHGYPENLQLFAGLALQLSAAHEVIAFDWPGMGHSDAWPGGAAPVNMAKHLLELMDEWKIEKAHLIGQDMGGQPALVFASLFPDRVHSVTIMNSLLYPGIETSWEIKLLRKFKINKLLLLHFPRLVFWRALHTFFHSAYSLSSELREDIWTTFKEKKVREFIVRMCAGYEAQLKRLPSMYKEIRCPVLILWADDDKHFPVAQAMQLKKELPPSDLHIIKDAGHWMVLEKANELVPIIRAFYKGIRN